MYMYCSDSKIFIEDDDLCLSCINYVNNVNCPLLSALVQGDVFLEDSLTVTKCGFYKEFKRYLHIVKGKNNDNNNSD